MWGSGGARRRSEDLVGRAREELAARPSAGPGRPAPAGGPAGAAARTGTTALGRPALLLPLAFIGYVVLRVAVGDELRTRVDEQACALTGCTGTGMAVAGWLLIALPALWAATTVRLWSGLSRPARVAAVLVGLALGLVAWVHVPGRHSSLAEILAGPAAAALATGIRWAGIAVALAAVAAVTVAGRRPNRRADDGRGPRPVAALVAVTLLGSLAVAVARAEPAPVTLATALPERTFRSAGDTLSRTAGRDLRGCAGLLVDDRLLEGCVRTVRASYTTDDSDAVVHLAAVLFPSEQRARERRGALRRDVGSTGVPGDVITVSSTTGSWVLLTSVGHADGRRVVEADRGHLLWAAKQVAYRFIGRQVGLLVAPAPADGIGPRTV
ncbi:MULTISPECIES: hypothetical protein [Micromonospora]|uniref:Uncharacterized protein n=1 Tax=Micromonospora solifontis TaxID=2487138 RepID=A0ABX9WDP4_9ACTN|nr:MULTISPECIES: hypothetical protein [Micromonospora]NES16823.1 hypothetical protein [Micromonospora sp. PPF5-17B]NES37841.1 hypothetical protein [Micromonospora solifontis]NES58539.1 hypothetical protein [Micromonospora sp. PPF5-6]RNL97936.1 hypothetical protein EFE23_17040 [Micromonospora solifontis]